MDSQNSQLSLDNAGRMSRLHFIFVAAVTIFLYFELMTQIWFVKLLGGYLVKVWLPPFILFIYLFSKMMLRGKSTLRLDFLNSMLLFYSVFGLISMLINEETLHLAIKYYLVMIAPIWFYAFIIDSFKDNRDIELMIKVLFWSCILLSIYTYSLQKQYLTSPSGTTVEEITTSAGNILELNRPTLYGTTEIEFQRAVVGYEMGKYCGMLAPAVLFGILLFLKLPNRTKYIYIVLSFIMLFQIVNTISRAGLVSTFIGIGFLISLLYIHERNIRIKIVLFSSLTFGLTFIYFLSRNGINLIFIRLAEILSRLGVDRFNDYLDAHGFSGFVAGSSYIDPHIFSIGESLKAFIENPFLGNGYTFSEQYLWEHNRYLFILTSSGLLTIVPYILFLMGLIFLVRRAMLHGKSCKATGINYIYLLYACNIIFLFKLLNEGMETFFYWIFFALATAWIRNIKREGFHSEGLINRNESNSISLAYTS